MDQATIRTLMVGLSVGDEIEVLLVGTGRWAGRRRRDSGRYNGVYELGGSGRVTFGVVVARDGKLLALEPSYITSVRKIGAPNE